MSSLELAILCSYGVLLVGLSLFSVHRVLLAWSARRYLQRPPVPAPLPAAALPSVVVQLPLFNERHVAQRLINHAARLDYPRHLLTIQVLDDSTDATTQLVAAAVEGWSRQGVNITHVRRPHRQGYKAGALAHGLALCNAELVAVFDADFVPEPNFLRRLVPHFADPQVGMVQATWGHLNRDTDVLTHSEAILLDAHFYNEHAGRAACGYLFNFNGTAGVWRRRAIEDAGGWLARTITEDLDLSYRAQLRGWRFVYRPDVVVAAELPPHVEAFKSQQHRWAKGSIQTARCLLPSLWRASQLSVGQRMHATLHLLGNLAYPGVILLALLMPAVVWARRGLLGWAPVLVDGSLVMGATGSLVAFYLLALRRSGAPARWVMYLPAALAMGVGLAVNNTRAVWEGLTATGGRFVRTPKGGGGRGEQPYFQEVTRGTAQATAEVLLGLYVLGALAMAGAYGQWGAVPFLFMFAWGFLSLGLGTWRARWASLALRGAAPPAPLSR